MIKTLFNGYADLMSRTLVISKLGALIMIVVSFTEVVRITNGTFQAENVAWDHVAHWYVPPLSYLVVFGTRFGLLIRYPLVTMIHAVCWLASAAAVVACLALYGPQLIAHGSTFTIYSFLDSFPLESLGVFFLVLSLVRFVLTAFAALSNEFDSNS